MKKYYILYNPFAGNNTGERSALKIKAKIEPKMEHPVELVDMTKIDDYKDFFQAHSGAGIIICGGDGTLNRFINETSEIDFENNIKIKNITIELKSGTDSDGVQDYVYDQFGVRPQIKFRTEEYNG